MTLARRRKKPHREPVRIGGLLTARTWDGAFADVIRFSAQANPMTMTLPLGQGFPNRKASALALSRNPQVLTMTASAPA
jgi:hypothetical protein